ncbi:MAG: DNA internalization-related competence protein ComEC/Rec2, partial [Gemmatimonadaceae bacterium]
VAYAAGLLLGFGGHLALSLPLCIAACGSWCLRRRPTDACIALFLGAGLLGAIGSAAREAGCLARMTSRQSWRVALHRSAGPGEYVAGELREGGCTMPAGLAIERGRARAGDIVEVRGDLAPARRGVLFRRARVAATGERDALIAWRSRAGGAIDTIFREDAPIVRALLIADASGLDAEVRDRYSSAGLVHMLSISGLHVAIIAGAVELVLTAMRLSRSSAPVAAFALTAVYVALIGAPAPAVRAGAMLGVGTLCRRLGRPTSPWAALAVGAWLPLLIEARTANDLGYQLSVIGIAGLIASGSLVRRWLAPRLAGHPLAISSVLLTSAVATIVSAPVVAWHFGRLSLIAPLTNAVATPVIAIVQPALFLALVLAPVPTLANFVADATHPLLAAFDRIAVVGSQVPHAALSVAPSLATAILVAVAAVALVVACVSYFPARALVAAISSMLVAVWSPLAPARGGEMELHLIDVGQGDAIAIRSPRGRWLLVDAGRSWGTGDDGRRVVIPYLRRRGGDLAAFVLSHPHSDHAGGAPSVIRALRPREYWDGAYVAASEPYRESLLAAGERGVRWHRARPGDSALVDGVRVAFLAPDSAWTRQLDDPNEASVVMSVRYGALKFLLVGDAERREEEWLLDHAAADLRADVLKVGHHGSATSTTAAFLAAVRPRVALVSVGTGNSYGHPSADVVLALGASGAEVLRTDRDGTIVLRTDGHSLEVRMPDGSWRAVPP